MKMTKEIIEKDRYRSTSSSPTIYKLLIDCEGTYDEINLFQNKLDKFIDNGMKTNYTQQRLSAEPTDIANKRINQ